MRFSGEIILANHTPEGFCCQANLPLLQYLCVLNFYADDNLFYVASNLTMRPLTVTHLK